MTAPHPSFQWLLHALKVGVRLFPLSPGQKRPIPPRPFVGILIDDGLMDIAPTGPAGFDQVTTETLLRAANSSVLTIGQPRTLVFATAISMASSSNYNVVVVETTREFEGAWIERLNRRATLPPLAVNLPETRQ